MVVSTASVSSVADLTTLPFLITGAEPIPANWPKVTSWSLNKAVLAASTAFLASTNFLY